jgi:WD40 repeat protein
MNALRLFAVPLFCGVTFLAIGCTSERPTDVPPSAALTAGGHDQVVYSAESDGTIWVTDVNTDGIIYTGPVHKGDQVVIDPASSKLTLNGQVLSSKDINADEHRVFFLAGSQPMTAPPTTPDMTIERPADVPNAALLKGAGTSKLEYVANSDGTMWVTDSGSNTVIYSGRVVKGDDIVVDPDTNKLGVNGQKVYGQDLSHNEHRLFFLSSDDMNMTH